jgi:hypothetical protein
MNEVFIVAATLKARKLMKRRANQRIHLSSFRLKVSFSLHQDSIEFASKNGFNGGIITSIFNPPHTKEFTQGEIINKSLLILNSADRKLVTPALISPDFGGYFDPENETNKSKFLQDLGYVYHTKREGFISVELGENCPSILGKLLGKAVKSTRYETKIIVEIAMNNSKSTKSKYWSDEKIQKMNEFQVSLKTFRSKLDVDTIFTVVSMAVAPRSLGLQRKSSTSTHLRLNSAVFRADQAVDG